MAGRETAISPGAAQKRRAPPDRAGADPRLPAYPRGLVAAIAVLAVTVAAFAAWLR